MAIEINPRTQVARAIARGPAGSAGVPPIPRLDGPHLVFDMPDDTEIDVGNVIGPQGPLGSAQNFDTRAIAEASIITEGVTTIRVHGHTAAGDGGAGWYHAVAEEPDHDGKLQTADDQWWELGEPVAYPPMFGTDTAAAVSAHAYAQAKGSQCVFRPKDFGIDPDNADNSAGLTALASACSSAGSGVIIEFPPGLDYIVGPSLTVGAHFPAIFHDVDGLRIEMNGSRILCTHDFTATAGTVLYLIYLDECKNVVINNAHFEQPNYQNRGDGTRGVAGITLFGECVNVAVNNLTMVGGYAGVNGIRAVSGTRGRNLTINGADLRQVFYGLACQKNPDNVTARGMYMRQPGRSYIAYNISQHDLQIFSDASDAWNDCSIGNLYDAADTVILANYTQDITLNYTNRNETVVGSGTTSFVDILFKTTSGSAEGMGVISGLNLDINVRRSDARGGVLLMVLNSTSTPQGRVLENVDIRINAHMNTATGDSVQLMTDKDWTGDFVRNMQISRTFLSLGTGTHAFRVDGRAIAGPFILDGVKGGADNSFVATNMGGAAQFLAYRQVWLPTAITP